MNALGMVVVGVKAGRLLSNRMQGQSLSEPCCLSASCGGDIGAAAKSIIAGVVGAP